MCKEMKRADGQIDIQKPDFMCLFSFLQYSYLYISLFNSSLFIYSNVPAEFGYRRCGIIAQTLAPPPPPPPPQKKKKSKKTQKFRRT